MSKKGEKRHLEDDTPDDTGSPAKKNKGSTPKTPTPKPSNSPKTPHIPEANMSTVIDQEDNVTPITSGTTLETVRMIYDNTSLWLVECESKAIIAVPNYQLLPGKEYKIHVPRQRVEATELHTKEEICKILEDIPSASTYASPNIAGCWRRNAGISKFMKVHRPNSGTPVVLLDPVLSELYDDIVYNKYVPSTHDCTAALKLMEALSCGFDSEPLMQAFIHKWAVSLDWPLTRSGNADGTWIMGPNLLLNLELKNEKGNGGGSSYMQNVGHFTKHWADETRKSTWKKSLCPTILIEITGPEIAVSGAVLDEQGVLCDPFATTSLLFNIYDHNHLVCAARMLGAVTKAVKNLESYYQKFDVPCDGFPFFRTIDPQEYLYESNHNEIKIKYTRKIKELLYQADLKVGESDPEKVIVKFTHSYNKKAHEICESVKCAPNLYFVGQVSRFQVVVMEQIENAKPWHAVGHGKRKEAAKKVVEEAIAKLHENGLVHGDLRSTNILLSGKRVAVIDFDWSGPPSQAYPLFINHTNIDWPAGVGDGELLDYEHDNEWINRNFV